MMMNKNFKKNSTFYGGGGGDRGGYRSNNIAKKMKSYSDSPNASKRK